MPQENFRNIHIRRYRLVTYIFISASSNKPWKSFVKDVILSTQQLTSGYAGKPLTTVASIYRCANVGASNDLLLPSTQLHFKEILQILRPCNLLTLRAMLPQMHIVPSFISCNSIIHINPSINCFICLWCGATSNVLDSTSDLINEP